MSLSSSTLNLKFMQRAAVRNAQQSTSTPNRPTPPASSLTPGPSTPSGETKPSPSVRGESISTPTPGSREDSPAVPVLVGLAAEQEAKARWVLPPRSRSGVKLEPGTEAQIPSRSGASAGRVTFESSYLPFILDSVEAEAGPSRPGKFSGGGGRMAFGGFGEAPKVDEEEEEEEDVEVEGQERQGQKDGGRKGKGRQDEGVDGKGKKGRGDVFVDKAEMEGKARGKKERMRDDGSSAGSKSGPYAVTRDTKPHIPQPKPHTTAQGFVRPANYTSDLPRPNPPNPSTSSTSRPKASQPDIKPTIPPSQGEKRKSTTDSNPASSSSQSGAIPGKTGKKRTKSSASASTPVKVEGVKRAKLDLSQTAATAAATAVAPALDLDARERAAKAERKKEKKAKRKMQAGEGVVV